MTATEQKVSLLDLIEKASISANPILLTNRIKYEFKIDYAHRLLNYIDPTTGKRGKCANIHGHTARVVFTIDRLGLDSNQMVIDFNICKALQLAVDGYLDHALVLAVDDPLYKDLQDLINKYDLKVLPIPASPTAEVLSRHAWTIMQLTIFEWFSASEDTRTLSDEELKQKLYHSLAFFISSCEWYESPHASAIFIPSVEEYKDVVKSFLRHRANLKNESTTQH